MSNFKSMGDVFEELYYTVSDFVKALSNAASKVNVKSTDDGISVECVVPELKEYDPDKVDAISETMMDVLLEWKDYIEIQDFNKPCTVTFKSGDKSLTYSWDSSLGKFVTEFNGTRYAFDDENMDVVEICRVECEEKPVDDYRDTESDEKPTDDPRDPELRDEAEDQADDVVPEDWAGAGVDECKHEDYSSYAFNLRKELRRKDDSAATARKLVKGVEYAISEGNFRYDYFGDYVDVKLRDIYPDDDEFQKNMVDGIVDFAIAESIFTKDLGFSRISYFGFPTDDPVVRLIF